VLRVGVNDCFGRSGGAKQLLDLYGLTPEAIAARARDAIGMK
jgi:transketolase